MESQPPGDWSSAACILCAEAVGGKSSAHSQGNKREAEELRRLENKKTLIIVTGGPGTGKSYAAARIQEEIAGLRAISYDALKEKNWDIFGFDNKEQKEEVNRLGLQEFYLSVRKAMRGGETLLLEYPFYQYHRPHLKKLAEEYGYRVITVYLHGELKTVYERSISRDTDGKRHPGHLTDCYHSGETMRQAVDAIPDYEGFCKWMRERDYNIGLGDTVDVDVTDFKRVDYEKIIEQITTYAGNRL